MKAPKTNAFAVKAQRREKAMLLYRARTVSSRPTRLKTPASDGPSFRAVGRWFTSNIEAAYRHAETLEGKSEIICVEILDQLAESFNVANNPHTQCGLSPIAHSIDPQHDYILPRFWVDKAELVEIVSDDEAVIMPIMPNMNVIRHERFNDHSGLAVAA